MSYLVKGLAGAAGCSGVCGGYFAVKHLSSGEEDSRSTVRSLLIGSGRTVLTKESDSDQWKERWKEYVAASGNPMGIEGYATHSSNQNNVPEVFKEKCLSQLDEKVSGVEDKLFKDLSTWCVKMTAVSELINVDGKRETLNSNRGDDEGWKASWKDYIDNSKDNSWSINNWNDAKTKPDTVPPDFKTKCTSKLAEKAFGVMDIKFANVVSWCTKVKSGG
ncbi:hypothetical protein MHF_1278 [Mycoplasma haemofelis Ohio2]|uniref:Uncharacterized protein n=1 Tax=Mycoplasma haemofelis (strain Ohio2) TaxID=859194 RepID=F6FFU6_MYCHI|nr:hypothetical protein MHF_1278 [Mycoplasma haemofelis Ohio2]